MQLFLGHCELHGSQLLIHKIVCKCKFLGLSIDQHLSWEPHIVHIQKRIMTITRAFFRTSEFIPVNTKRQLYFSLVHSHNFSVQHLGLHIPISLTKTAYSAKKGNQNSLNYSNLGTPNLVFDHLLTACKSFRCELIAPIFVWPNRAFVLWV